MKPIYPSSLSYYLNNFVQTSGFFLFYLILIGLVISNFYFFGNIYILHLLLISLLIFCIYQHFTTIQKSYKEEKLSIEKIFLGKLSVENQEKYIKNNPKSENVIELINDRNHKKSLVETELNLINTLEMFLDFENIFSDIVNADFIYDKSKDFIEKFKVLREHDNNPRRRKQVLDYLGNKLNFYTYYQIFGFFHIKDIDISKKYKRHIIPNKGKLSKTKEKDLDSVFIALINDTIAYKKQIVDIINGNTNIRPSKIYFINKAPKDPNIGEKIELKILIFDYLKSKHKYFYSDYDKIQNLKKIYQKYLSYFTEIFVKQEDYIDIFNKSSDPGKLLLTNTKKDLYLKNKNVEEVISNNKFVKSDQISAKKINGNDILEEINQILGVSEKFTDYLKPGVRSKSELEGCDEDQKLIAYTIFPKLQGLDFKNINLNITDSFYEKIYSDVDGHWYFVQSHMMFLAKAFSKQNFKKSLKFLLEKNKIKSDDFVIENQIKKWNGKGFKIENPPEKDNVNLIIISNENLTHKSHAELLKTNLTDEVQLPEECEINGIDFIYDGNDLMKKSKDPINDLLNVPMLQQDEEDNSYYILILNPNFNPAKLIIDSIVEKNGGKENFKFDEKIDDSWLHTYSGKNFGVGYLEKYKTIRINFLNFSDEIAELKHNLELLSPPIGTADFWIDILNKRGASRKMFKEFNQTFNDSSKGHAKEYILKYENDEMTIEDIYNRIDVYNLFIEQYEIFFNKQQELNNTINEEIENMFFALVESLAGAELTLLMIKDNHNEVIDEDKIFNIIERPNNEVVEDDENGTNSDLEDKDIFTYYKGYLFNGTLIINNKDGSKHEFTMRFGLKHGFYKTYNSGGKVIETKKYFNDLIYN